MERFLLTAPCNFGLEALLAREINDLGYDVKEVRDGRVDFWGDRAAICYANLWLRTAERVLLKIGEFTARSFEELYQGVKALDWGAYLPREANFPVAKADSMRSQLFSTSDIQSVTKKAVVDKLFQHYQTTELPESGAHYPIQVLMHKDLASIYLDTTGTPLHKRGYRLATNIAPIKETLAAALVMLTPWQPGRPLLDPLCGSGTILIEAALRGLNLAPGLKRSFLCESWPFFADGMWREIRQDSLEMAAPEQDFLIQGYDSDARVLAMARQNAAAAGVEKQIHFQQRDVAQLASPAQYGFIVTNPPYGERMAEKQQAQALYRVMGERFQALESWSYYIISADAQFEQYFGRQADKKRKLYNGMLRCDLYQYFGPKPPRKPAAVEAQV